MAYQRIKNVYEAILRDLKNSNCYKIEQSLTSKQGEVIKINNKDFINFVSSNYLGYSNSQESVLSAISTTQKYGFGLSSGRIICGTLDIHKSLESKISQFHGTEDSLLYSSCFDANSGLFEALLNKEDVVLSDSLNNASISDGIRLSSAAKMTYNHLDMSSLEDCLKDTQSKRIRLIATDGLFSLDGELAPLQEIVNLAEKYNALIAVDDSHAVGPIGKTGRGTSEYFGVMDKIDVINCSFGKAMGGATGGYSSGRQEIIEVLRQRSRPYIFTNSLAPMIVGAALAVFEDIDRGGLKLMRDLRQNIQMFRERLTECGFRVLGNRESPIVGISISDEAVCRRVIDKLTSENVLVFGLFPPDVPKGQTRIRVQISARHTLDQINKAVDIFRDIGREEGIINKSIYK